MRRWYKYSLDFSGRGRKYISLDHTYSEHAKAMGGYRADEAYNNKDAFFRKYFFNYQLSRLEQYYDFIKKHLNKTSDIFSIASGRCALELYLMEEGYKITCSDLDFLYAAEETRALFKDFKYIKYDVLSGPTAQKYDAILSLSLITLFNDRELSAFFYNIAQSLKPEGQLILDPGSSPDNLISFLIHDGVLRYEVLLRRWVRLVKDLRWHGLIKRHFGYRRKDKEIIEVARQAGLVLLDQENCAFLTEFRRSYVLNKLMERAPFSKALFSEVGNLVPYIRMYNFKKIV